MRFNAGALAAAYALDIAVGDPWGTTHPVRVIGAVIAGGERLLLPRVRANARRELFAGMMLTLTIVAGTYAATDLLLREVNRRHSPSANTLAVFLASTTLATHDLLREVRMIAERLACDDLPGARAQLARVVGRDTARLDHHEIARAAIETSAESLCDGIIAPLCALAVGGVPAAMAFKAINTLDSMIGHIEAPYTFFGRFTARLDDVANYVPARLTAGLILLCGGAPARALRTLRCDARSHRSPNAGYPEAAAAGSLGVRLGGMNTYSGTPHAAPVIGKTLRPPTEGDIHAALRLIRTVSFIGGLGAVLARTLITRRSPK